MRNKWQLRLLFSYIPVFLIIVLFIMAMVYLVLIEISKNQTRRSHEVFTNQVMQSIDFQLKAIDQLMMKEIRNNNQFRQFLQGNNMDDPYTIYEVSRDLTAIVQSTNLIDSIYIVRLSDWMVISDQQMIPNIHLFDDADYIEGMIEHLNVHSWSGARSYKGYVGSGERNVVTLVRQAPLFSGTQGVVAINVNIRSLQQLINEMSGTRFSYVQLQDDKSQTIILTNRSDNLLDHRGKTGEAYSTYTGWILISGFQESGIFDFMTTISYVWIGLILSSLLIGVYWFWYSVRRNYKPIKSLLDRIDSEELFNKQDFGIAQSRDEFYTIESSLSYLVDKYNHIEKKYAEDSVYKKNHMFLQYMLGNADSINNETLTELGFNSDEGRFCCIVVEIDQYTNFVSCFNSKDQELLKYVLKKTTEESAESFHIPNWSEWLDPLRLGIIIELQQGGSEESIEHLLICEQISKWCKTNLKFTVTIGLGNEVNQFSQVSQSAHEAIESLEYKAILGDNRIILYSEIEPKRSNGSHDHIQRIVEAIEAFKLRVEHWQTKVHEMFEGFRNDVLSKTELLRYLNYFNVQLDNEMIHLSNDIRHYWKNGPMLQLYESLDKLDDLWEVEQRLVVILQDVAENIMRINNSRIINDKHIRIKMFIEDHFSDPNMSLHMVSVQFNLNPSHLSRLFKEEFNVRFIDYLTSLRINRAKQLLIETDLPINDIAEKVGYMHAFSFIRAFKKSEKLTPGYYRKVKNGE
ncbi:helix-turn-helix domain-containing protein [Paenibacillus chungangensis]|uniref:Helix-turn-helix domain-containing protein n=1 Tax=Paenibacillus chungangensis TaxID=696535 RepID=A0ABW3HU71_9BACL